MPNNTCCHNRNTQENVSFFISLKLCYKEKHSIFDNANYFMKNSKKSILFTKFCSVLVTKSVGDNMALAHVQKKTDLKIIQVMKVPTCNI